MSDSAAPSEPVQDAVQGQEYVVWLIECPWGIECTTSLSWVDWVSNQNHERWLDRPWETIELTDRSEFLRLKASYLQGFGARLPTYPTMPPNFEWAAWWVIPETGEIDMKGQKDEACITMGCKSQ
jgi:hypothetical protein